MGWGRALLLGPIGNRMDIEDTERDIEYLKGKVMRSNKRDLSQDEKINSLMEENAELKLYLAALVRLLTAKGTISPENLKTMVDAIDAADGEDDSEWDDDIV